jgi:hypothetical protein
MRIVPEKTTAIIIDLQDRLLPHMHEHEAVLSRCTLLMSGLTLLGIPMTLTEQYPAGLGKSVDELRVFPVAGHPVEKVTFSCCDEPSVIAQLKKYGRGTVLLAGIEAHVCVLQTALDLKASGFDPVIVADAVASRRESDKVIALQRLDREGCRITTVESILFELMRTSRHAVFKEISKLVK